MKINDIYDENEDLSMDNDSIDDELPPDENNELLNFSHVNLSDDEMVTLEKDAKVLFTDTWGNVKSYFTDNIQTLYGTYNVLYNGMVVFTVTLAG